jgi:hypothetical protein
VLKAVTNAWCAASSTLSRSAGGTARKARPVPPDATARESSWTWDDADVPATSGVSVDSIFDSKIEPRPAILVASPSWRAVLFAPEAAQPGY